MEVSALNPSQLPCLRGPSPLLKLQSDEKLIALTRRGQHAAFETLFGRYQSRLMAFCRHMLGSKEDAEDVLQEVFAAAFNAILADEREINVRPWLYRIARNRSLNHLRRASAVGVDSMDIHFADNGLSTGERVLRRESFRQLVGDVQQLPETQRTALLLREIDALSYEQIAHAMETTVPSVKSLLVRARISLAEAAESRMLTCEQVRVELGEAAEGLVKVSSPVRRHVRSCERCRFFRKQLKENNVALAAIMPVGPLLLLKKLLFAKLGSASAGGAHVAGAGSATAAGGSSAAGGLAGAAGGSSAAGGLVTASAGAIATKAVAGLAAAALVTAGAVEANRASVAHQSRPHVAATAGYAGTPAGAPQIVSSTPQPSSVGASYAPAPPPLHSSRAGARGRDARNRAQSKPAAVKPQPPDPGDAAATTKLAAAKSQTPPGTEVTSETTQLPAATTATPVSAEQSASSSSAGSAPAISSSTGGPTQEATTTTTASSSSPSTAPSEASQEETTTLSTTSSAGAATGEATTDEGGQPGPETSGAASPHGTPTAGE